MSRLVELGFAQRLADPTDGRVVLVALTDAGACSLAEQRRVGCETAVELVDGLSDDEVKALSAALPAIEQIHSLESLPRGPRAVAQVSS